MMMMRLKLETCSIHFTKWPALGVSCTRPVTLPKGRMLTLSPLSIQQAVELISLDDVDPGRALCRVLRLQLHFAGRGMGVQQALTLRQKLRHTLEALCDGNRMYESG